MRILPVRIGLPQLKLPDEAQVRRPLEATWILLAARCFTPTGRRKSEKRYPVVMKDISHVKIVSLHIRC